MTDSTLSRYYIHKSDEVKLSLLWTVSERSEGNVRFAPAWGGFVKSAGQAIFDAEFSQVPQATIDSLMKTFKPALVSCGDDFDNHMQGFVNGQLWNGWLTPWFSREVIEAEMEEGGYLSPARIGDLAFFFDGDDLYELSPAEGISFPSDFDLTKVKELVRTSSSPEELEDALEKVGVIGYKNEPRDIMVEGSDKPVCVYPVGNGWTWEAALELDNAPPAPAM